MELKKSPKADLENRKLTFLLLGLVIAFGVTYISLEWVQRSITKFDDFGAGVVEEFEEIMHTFQEPPPPPPPEDIPPPPPVVSAELEIVPDDEYVDDIGFTPPDDAPIEFAPPDIVETIDEEYIFINPEVMPTFPGDLNRWLSDNIRFPASAIAMNVQERIIVQFVIERDGSVADVEVILGQNESLRNEAIRLVNSMPRWRPGEQGGQAVRVRFSLPIHFRL